MKKIRKWSLIMKIISTVTKLLFFKITDLYTYSLNMQTTKTSSTSEKWNFNFAKNYSKCLLMFDSITFHSDLHFGYSATFVYFSLHPLWICYAARCVHFTVPSGRRGALFFLREQMCTIGSTFIKKIFSVIILVCIGNTQKNKTARQTASSLVLLV